MADDHNRPVFARTYAWLSQRMEAELGERREQLLQELSGRVLEVGAGNGMNFAHYPATVQEVVAVEPEPHLRELARRAASRAPVPVTVVDGTAERLPVDDQEYDAVVTSLVLCSVRDPDQAVSEVRRVLRPGGQFRFLEHVRADTRLLSGAQRVMDATVWPRVAGGCHASRDIVGVIRRSGLELTGLEKVRFPDIRISTPTSPHVLGAAVRPPA